MRTEKQLSKKWKEKFMHGHGVFGLGMGWGWIIGLIIVVAIIWMVFKFMNQQKQITNNKSALDLLNERYAKGEIDKAEYEEKKKDLVS
ncbi:MAG TPA: SHOCT domain-containing protein [Bacteroidales bacterium]|nr:SHOCT domain-containing protein [Bacteroidales bacterium]